MATTCKFELVSPEKILLSADVEHVVLPGVEGDFGVMAGHAPSVVALRPGVIQVLTGTSVTQQFYVKGGYAEVNPDMLTVLAARAFDLENADKGEIADEIKAAETEVSESDNDEARRLAQSALATLQSLAA